VRLRLRWRRRKKAVEGEDFPGLPRRRKLLIALLAVTMAVVVVLMLTERPGSSDIDPRLLQADSQRCAAGQSKGCVGGRAEVIMLAPAPAAASGARP
jgi:hypothetical protein